MASPGLATPDIPLGGRLESSKKTQSASETVPTGQLVGKNEEPPMESLFQLVAESFARHGIADQPITNWQVSAPTSRPTEASHPEALPEHNYRQSKEAILTP